MKAAGGYMGATVDWHPLIAAIYVALYITVGLLIAGGLGWLLWDAYAERIRWKLRCRRYWRSHPYYEDRHWKTQGRRGRARD